LLDSIHSSVLNLKRLSAACVFPISGHQASRRLSELVFGLKKLLTVVIHTNIAAFNGSLRCAKSQTNIFVPSSATLSDSLALGLGLGVEENMRLLLERTFRLDSQLGRHGCENSVRHGEEKCRADRRTRRWEGEVSAVVSSMLDATIGALESQHDNID
jgi:hypothetical protein